MIETVPLAEATAEACESAKPEEEVEVEVEFSCAEAAALEALPEENVMATMVVLLAVAVALLIEVPLTAEVDIDCVVIWVCEDVVWLFSKFPKKEMSVPKSACSGSLKCKPP